MGFDVSFHPVDLELIRQRLVPFVMGRGSIDDLVARAVEIARIRQRANAWALGALKLSEDLDDLDPFDDFTDSEQPLERAEAPSSQSHATSASEDLYEELEGSGIIVAPSYASGKRDRPFESEHCTQPSLVNSELHVWGRPFFVTATDPISVSEIIDSYLDANLERVDAIAKSELERLDPALARAVMPELEGEPASDQELAQEIRWKLDLLRRCYEAERAGSGSVVLPDGEKANPAELLAREVPLALLEFSAHFRPGWMARGVVWPTVLLQEAEIDDAGCFETPRELLEPLAEALGRVSFFLEPTITENYMVGGYVRPQKVPLLRTHLEQNFQRVVAKARDAGWQEECKSALAKILEALSDAERRGMGFAEATEIYSGIQGIMN